MEVFTCSETANSFSSEPLLSCGLLTGGDSLTLLSYAVSEVIAGDLNGGTDLLVLQITFEGKKTKQNKIKQE